MVGGRRQHDTTASSAERRNDAGELPVRDPAVHAVSFEQALTAVGSSDQHVHPGGRCDLDTARSHADEDDRAEEPGRESTEPLP